MDALWRNKRQLYKKCCCFPNVLDVWPGPYTDVAPGHAHEFDFNMLRPPMLRYIASQCCDRLARALCSIRKIMLHEKVDHFQVSPNKFATGWPNSSSMLLTTMLRYVAFKRCDHLAGI